LVVEIEQTTGTKLPLGVLYQAPSIEALANIIEEHKEERWSALVPLQPKGTKPPLFFLHTTPGDVLGYGNLVYHLGLDQPCYGFQSLGLHQKELSHQTVEEMIRYYIERLREAQPKGPYLLAGWCYGGIIAVEMANQLIAAGEEVAFLGLIETPAPPPSERKAAYYFHRFKCFVGMRPRRLLSYLGEKVKYYRGLAEVEEKRFKRDEVPSGTDNGAAQARNRWLDQLEHVYNTNMKALHAYRVKPYPGKMVLFNARTQHPSLLEDPDYGWKPLVPNLHKYVVNGDHDTILMEPNVQELARLMAAELRIATQKS
jgi:aspartate racemase